MFKFSHCIVSVVLTPLLLAGCLPSEPEKVGGAESIQMHATPGQLVETLIQMSREPDKFNEAPDRHIFAQQLDAMGPTALTSLLEYMAAPETDPKARLFILQCVSNYLTPAYLPVILPMVESKDQVLRAIAINALGPIQHETIPELLRTARNDPAPRVAFSALSSLAMQGEADAREELKAMYINGSTMGDIQVEQIKQEAVRVLVRNALPDDLPVLADALNQPFIEINRRAAIAETLGRMGDSSVIPLLEQSLDLQKETAYGEMVRAAIAAIQEREGKA